MSANRLSGSQTLAPGIAVSGKAWLIGGRLIEASLSAKLPTGDSGWYWEAAAQAPSDPAAPEQNLQDWPASDQPDSDFPFLVGSAKDADSLSQAKLTGELVHFKSFRETAECEIKVGRDPASGQLRMQGDAIVTTNSGFRFRLYPADLAPLSGDNGESQVRFSVELDPETAGNGLHGQPDRLELWITPPQVGVGFSPLPSVQALLDHTSSVTWRLTKDQVQPVVTLKLRINRRVADRKLPFSLTVPLQRRDGQSVAPPAP